MSQGFKDVLFFQRLLASCGLYKGALDGDYGPMTHAAEDAFNGLYTATKMQLGTFDPRSEAAIMTLLPKAQTAARKFMNLAKHGNGVSPGVPFDVKLLSGTRTYAEQNQLFAQHPRVTNARGGQSNHNFGIAWDVGIFVNGQYYTGRTPAEEKAYDDLAHLIKPQMPELEWGGGWHSIVDKPHYQMATGKTVSECRMLLEQGKPYV